MKKLEVNHLKKTYVPRFGNEKVRALNDVNFSVDEGEFVAVMGESGAGKSTLLNILATLDTPSGGEVRIGGRDLSQVKEEDRTRFRREHLGFIFQDFNLLNTLSLKDNILLPLVLAGKNPDEMTVKLMPLARKLGIFDQLEKYPYEVSGGQKQRAAAARALITSPEILLADEPTGALDSKSSDELLDLMDQVNQDGQTILMVTHSVKAASRASRVLFIQDGRVMHQLFKGDQSDSEFFDKIARALSILASESKKGRIAPQGVAR